MRLRKFAYGAVLGVAFVAAAPALSDPAIVAGQPTATPSPPPRAPPAKPDAQNEIFITGSRIPRPNLTAVSPVTVVTSKEVKLEGAVLTESLLNTLPQVEPNQGLFLSNGASGTATVDLRSFGPGRTLVLINGRRLLPGDPQYAAADINFVPSALIQRVDVLTGGASSVYGSDAIAGVVNFILDTRLDGLRVDAQSSFYQHDNRNKAVRSLLQDAGFSSPEGNAEDGAIEDINAVFGFGFAHGHGHLTVYAGYRQSQALTEAARDYSACAISVDTPDDSPFCGGSTASQAGTFVIPRFGFTYHVAGGRLFAPNASLFNFAPYNFYQRPDRRYSTGGFAEFDVSSGFKPYVEAMYMDDRTTAQLAPSADFAAPPQTINCDNPLLSAQQVSLICFNGNFVGQRAVFDDNGELLRIVGRPTLFTDPTTGRTYFKGQLRIRRRNVEGGPRQEILSHRDLRLVVGSKGTLGHGISYDASYLFARVKQADFHTNDLLVSRLANALDVVSDPSSGRPVCRSRLSGAEPNCLPWDIFSVGTVTPDAAAYLAVPSSLTGKVQEQVVNGSVTVDLGEWGLRSPWAEEAPALNVGAEYRKDKLSLDPDEHFANADLVGIGTPITPLRGTTSVKELFGEVRLPLLRRRLIDELTLEGGYRLSWYRNAGNRLSSSSYKFGAELAPVHGIRLRASQQRAVRAANVQELFAQSFEDNFGTDPCAGFKPTATQQQCAATGVTASQYGQIERQTDASIGYNGIGGGNAALLPEVARTRTVGIVVRPEFLRSFTLTADWFDIRLKRAIDVIGSQTIVDTCIATADPLFCNRIHRDSEGSLWLTPQGFVDNTNANIGALENRGVDIASSYTQPIGRLGSVGFDFQGTWVYRFTVDAGGLATAFDCAGLYGRVCGTPTPKWRHNARLTWNAPHDLSLSLLWRHWSSIPADVTLAKAQQDFDYNPVSLRIPRRDYFDLTGIAHLGARFQIRLGVRNLFDREPPIIVGGQNGVCAAPFCNGNTAPQFYDPLGRFIFAGVTLNFKP